LSPELQRELNIGLDLVLLEQLKEDQDLGVCVKDSSSTLRPPSCFAPPQKQNPVDATFGLLSLNINDTHKINNDDTKGSQLNCNASWGLK
jgi:hypothetical protein